MPNTEFTYPQDLTLNLAGRVEKMEKTLEKAMEMLQSLTGEKPLIKQEEMAAEHTASDM